MFLFLFAAIATGIDFVLLSLDSFQLAHQLLEYIPIIYADVFSFKKKLKTTQNWLKQHRIHCVSSPFLQ